MKERLIVTLVAAFVAVVSWVPLWIVEKLDPYSMPVGLGLLTFGVSTIAGVVALIGLIRVVIYAARASR